MDCYGVRYALVVGPIQIRPDNRPVLDAIARARRPPGIAVVPLDIGGRELAALKGIVGIAFNSTSRRRVPGAHDCWLGWRTWTWSRSREKDELAAFHPCRQIARAWRSTTRAADIGAPTNRASRHC
jgi:hypothetical protein